MKFIFIFLLLVSASASAQTEFKNNLDVYRNLSMVEFPASSKVIFERDLMLLRNENHTPIAKLKTGEQCFFYIPDSKNKPQVIPAGTEREISSAGNNWSRVYINEKKTVSLYCKKDGITIGEFVEAFEGLARFIFVNPPKPEIYEFP